MNLNLMLKRAAERYGNKTALACGENRLSYAGFYEASNRVANYLKKIGVSKGDRVAMLLSNSPEAIVTYFGIVKTGAIAVPLDTKYKLTEITSLFDDFQPVALVSENPTLEPLIPVLSKFKSVKYVIDISGSYEGRFPDYRQIMAEGAAEWAGPEPDDGDIATLFYTSSPTFHPLGAMMSHRSLVMEAVSSTEGFKQTDSDVMMLYSLPIHHTLGLAVALMGSIYAGSTVVIVPGTGLSISSFAAAIERERGTIFIGVPYTFALTIDMAEGGEMKNDWSSLRLCVSAGAPLSHDIINGFKKHFGFDLADCWGLTEAVCHVTCPPIDGTAKFGSVGKTISIWEMKVVDGDGRELPPNQSGEILVSGPLMDGYYNKPQVTAETIKEGWLYTGDIGRIDESGTLFITGRKRELIIVKGQNIFPADIESVLLEHPKVAEAVVMGIPDRMRGEVVGVVVTLKEGKKATEQEIKRFCLKRLANYKVPKQVFFVESLPRTADGKVDKENLRASLSIPPVFPGATVPAGEV